LNRIEVSVTREILRRFAEKLVQFLVASQADGQVRDDSILVVPHKPPTAVGSRSQGAWAFLTILVAKIIHVFAVCNKSAETRLLARGRSRELRRVGNACAARDRQDDGGDCDE